MGLALREVVLPSIQIRAYLDTSILAIWFLYSTPPEYTPVPYDNRIRSSLTLLEGMRKNLYRCRFVTSDWAITELSHVIIENKIARKVMESGHSLSHFGKFKKYFRLNPSERRELNEIMADLFQLMRQVRIKREKAIMNIERIRELMMKHGLETGDAVHISYAIDRCQFFVTNDYDLKDKKNIGGLRIVLPDTFLNEATRLRLLKSRFRGTTQL